HGLPESPGRARLLSGVDVWGPGWACAVPAPAGPAAGPSRQVSAGFRFGVIVRLEAPRAQHLDERPGLRAAAQAIEGRRGERREYARQHAADARGERVKRAAAINVQREKAVALRELHESLAREPAHVGAEHLDARRLAAEE